MITLHHANSTAAMLPHWLLIELDVPHSLHTMDTGKGEHKQPDYLRINPEGRVPTLVIDGAPITEAAAIALHLADSYGGGRLAPKLASPERAQYYRWMFFFANGLQPAYRAWFYPTEPAGPEHVAVAKQQARGEIERRLDLLSAHLQTRAYMLGETMSAVDFMATMMMRWSRNMPKPSDTWEPLRAHAARMKQLPSFREVYKREGLTDWT